MSVKAQKDPEKLSYEEAMSELESLVGRMEQGGLTLEESVESYARGIALTKACRAKLDRAEERIRKLDEEGKLSPVKASDLRPDSASRAEPAASAAASPAASISATFLSDAMNAKEKQMSEVSFRDWMKERQAHFESVAEAGIPGSDVFPQGLHEAMRWSILEGGKRVRPLLCYAASAITRAKPEAADAAALSLECIHSYSLVHDDLPCMDNDLLRHGKASTHAKFGFAEAVLAGDALQAEAFRVIADAPVEPRSAVRLTRILAEAAGSRGMCGGQAYDLSLTGSRNAAIAIEDLRRLHAMKTGALIRAAVLMGAVSGDIPETDERKLLDSLSDFGRAIGLAFQVVDDVLDVTGSAETLGKTAGKDEAEEKPTYVSLLGLEGARSLAQQSCSEALAALDQIESLPGYAGSTKRLAEIAGYVVNRDR